MKPVRKKRRRLVKSTTAANPPKYKHSFFHKFGELASFIADLREIAERGDRERLSVLVGQFEHEYPEIYQEISSLVEIPPGEAVDHLCSRWPALGVIKLFPKHLTMISMIQVEILNRRQTR